jgi:hypothetical protein
MDPTWLYYAASTIAQCAAALAALIGFFGLWRLERLYEEQSRLFQLFQRIQDAVIHDTLVLYGNEFYVQEARKKREAQPGSALAQAVERYDASRGEQQQLIHALIGFLIGTLALLCIAITLLAFVDVLDTWVWTMRVVICLAGLWLGGSPAYVMLQAVGRAGPIQRLWSRRAAQLQRAWTHIWNWCDPVLIITRL